MSIVDIDSLLQPVSDDAACGPNLEYDPEFLELEQAVLGKPETQYGDTITPAVPPEWKVVKRLALELLSRSRDFRVVLPLARAALALHGIRGLSDSLKLIERLLDERWDSVHPQLDPDDDMDPMLRINSLAALTDPGFLREVKEAALLPLPGLGAFSLRSLEVASGELAPAEGETKLELHSISAALVDADPEKVAGASEALVSACDSATRIEVILVRQVGTSQALNLDPLVRLLRRGRDFFASQQGDDGAGEAQAGGDAQGGDDGEGAAPAGGRGAGPRSAAISGDVASRADVLRMLDKINQYYAQYEPSSPVPLLLERAKRLVPKSFLEIMQDLAPDGVAQLLVISGQELKQQEDEY
ncbi:type VI secretion system protein TssA [Pseudoduganella namucuonensis]|uniref:Type VI secretion system protein ImpA n=1 Tax=Pseudoduganella namucuonensis TaxID=1035707 RepID=A0A1I7L531_9BURK|nr:type VI secretion system protein TssA [Pseudoduganella namucuonensis]SFV04791.1 type VI secretion system protein ImpA [Pseudoduganella namucuonensis]